MSSLEKCYPYAANYAAAQTYLNECIVDLITDWNSGGNEVDKFVNRLIRAEEAKAAAFEFIKA
ncbi:MAG: hypothetical protein ABSA68_02545 [Xanthobacteraceae bacterium]|jgi:hypothetical protein